ncbi:fungal-specific transcription factor domain-containing protein [Talaromyces proteolyticus]|uniref:Fungal-specific transcription factor domain-containing protein n=1 Tax=Talaromyces proteolyticus TaxID=1131652 RepID=A0AAD4KKK4_9EURO|nr:fungal-specific transcription factor domain-containing protein [Talaromyces proteolyticus]KAH8690613.1 fungal-specific transcription factor domain-containing protein [Talaromyces proteolyticus]
MASTLESRQYRSRKQKPCDLCRKRRICCIREPGSHSCSLCRTRNIDCTYVSSPPVRLRTPKERMRRSHVGNTTPTSPATESPSMQGRARIEELHHTLQYVGLSGDQDPYLLQHSSRDAKRQDDVAWACQTVNNDPVMPAQFTIVPDQHLDARPTYYPKNNVEESVHPYKEALIKTYFNIVHPSFPILDPIRFNPNSSSLLLASMYALSHKFCSEAGQIDPWIFLDFLGRALPLEARNPKLDSIEAALLYSQRHTYIFRAPTMPGMIAETGSLIGMSHDIGLNVDPTNWRISETDKKRRIRLWWAVYMQDKWVALTLGRPSFLHDEQSNVPMVTISDFDHGESEVSYLSALASSRIMYSVSTGMFVAMAELSVLLSDILSTFYTVRGIRRLREAPRQGMECVIDSFTNRLEGWYNIYNTLLQGDKRLLPDPTGKLLHLMYSTNKEFLMIT